MTRDDPEAAALARTAAMRRRLRAEQTLLTADEMAAVVGATAADIEGARRRGELLAIREEDGGWRFPSWQVQEGRPLAGLPEVLSAVAAIPIHSAWIALDFLTAPNAADDGGSVVGLLRAGRIGEALDVAHRYGETGA